MRYYKRLELTIEPVTRRYFQSTIIQGSIVQSSIIKLGFMIVTFMAKAQDGIDRAESGDSRDQWNQAEPAKFP